MHSIEMGEVDRHWWRSKELWIGIILLVIPSVLTSIIPGGWEWVFSVFGRFLRWLGTSTRIPVWFLTILSILSVLGLFLGWIFWRDFGRSSKDFHDSIFSKETAYGYDEDELLGIRWRFSNILGRMYRQELEPRPFCPTCDLEIVPVESSGKVEFRCDDCNKRLHLAASSLAAVKKQVVMKIQKRIRQLERNDRAKARAEKPK